MKTFKINDKTVIICNWKNTRNGFKHTAALMIDGFKKHQSRVCYLNRTWESFEFETVISQLLQASNILPEDQVKEFLDCCRRDNLEEVNRQFGFIAGIAKLGNILCDNQKDKNDWKQRMIKAGFGDAIIMPDDWNELSEAAKEERLNNVIKSMERVVQ